MCGGVTSGFAGVKFSGSPKRFGENRASAMRGVSMRINPRISLNEKYGWNGILSQSETRPRGLFEPVSCRKVKWTRVIPAIKKGSRKWMAKNRVRVGLSTENPPHAHSTRVCPMYGRAENRLVITVAPQNDICPHGRT